MVRFPLPLLALILTLASACSVRSARSGPNPADPDVLARLVAHELGHAAGLDHLPTGEFGVMAPTIDVMRFPEAKDWPSPRPSARACLNWGVEDEVLAQAVEIAGEAWCIASEGWWCPWVYDTENPPCAIGWGDLHSPTVGEINYDRMTITIDSSLRM